MAMKSQSFPMASSMMWPHCPTCKYWCMCTRTHMKTQLSAPVAAHVNLSALTAEFVKSTHMLHTHTHMHKSGQTAGECGSQWPICSPLWWAAREPNPRLISHSPVVEATHRRLYCLFFLSHLWNARRHSLRRTHSPWSVDLSVCLCLSVILCVCVCAAWALCGCGYTCKTTLSEVCARLYLLHPPTVADQ